MSSFATFLERILSWMTLMYIASCSRSGEVDIIVHSGLSSWRASARGSNFRSPFLMGVSLVSLPSEYSTPAKAAWMPPLE